MAKKSKKPSLVEQSTRREFLRKQQEAQHKIQARNRRIVISVAIVLGVVVASVFIGVFVNQAQRAGGGTVVPPSANGDQTGIIVNSPMAASAQHKVVVYFDYQCPPCADLEKTYGPQLQTAANTGTIALEFHAMTGLETQLRNDSSTRAAVGAACADTVGYYAAYHDQILLNQPERQGTGYTGEQLRNTFPAAVGISGADLTAFQQCYDTRATQQFVQKVADAGVQAGITGTPTVLVDGQVVDPATLPTLLATFAQEAAPSTPATPSTSATAAS